MLDQIEINVKSVVPGRYRKMNKLVFNINILDQQSNSLLFATNNQTIFIEFNKSTICKEPEQKLYVPSIYFQLSNFVYTIQMQVYQDQTLLFQKSTPSFSDFKSQQTLIEDDANFIMLIQKIQFINDINKLVSFGFPSILLSDNKLMMSKQLINSYIGLQISYKYGTFFCGQCNQFVDLCILRQEEINNILLDIVIYLPQFPRQYIKIQNINFIDLAKIQDINYNLYSIKISQLTLPYELMLFIDSLLICQSTDCGLQDFEKLCYSNILTQPLSDKFFDRVPSNEQKSIFKQVDRVTAQITDFQLKQQKSQKMQKPNYDLCFNSCQMQFWFRICTVFTPTTTGFEKPYITLNEAQINLLPKQEVLESSQLCIYSQIPSSHNIFINFDVLHCERQNKVLNLAYHMQFNNMQNVYSFVKNISFQSSNQGNSILFSESKTILGGVGLLRCQNQQLQQFSSLQQLAYGSLFQLQFPESKVDNIKQVLGNYDRSLCLKIFDISDHQNNHSCLMDLSMFGRDLSLPQDIVFSQEVINSKDLELMQYYVILRLSIQNISNNDVKIQMKQAKIHRSSLQGQKIINPLFYPLILLQVEKLIDVGEIKKQDADRQCSTFIASAFLPSELAQHISTIGQLVVALLFDPQTNTFDQKGFHIIQMLCNALAQLDELSNQQQLSESISSTQREIQRIMDLYGSLCVERAKLEKEYLDYSGK